MTVFYALCASAIIACAVHMTLSRNLLRMLLGLALLSTGVNLALFIGGGLASRQPPIVEAGAKALGVSSDPLVQALVLTAIVIGFGLLAFTLALVYRAFMTLGTVNSDEMRVAESVAQEARR